MLSRILSSIAYASMTAQMAIAQVFNGPGLQGGVGEAGFIQGPAKAPLRQVILSMLGKVLNFLALASVVMIVIAGVIFIMSSGKDEAKDRAKKIILYVALGLVIILLARAGVGFFLSGLS